MGIIMKAEEHLERCSLTQAGIRATGVKRFLEEVEKGGYHFHSFMITRKGKVAYECSWAPYRLDEEHLMHSFTKGLVAVAIGILEGEGRVALDDRLVSYFPEYELEDADGRLGQMTLRHLLTMTGGHENVPGRTGCDDEVLAFLRHPVMYEPGTRFMYNSLGTHMLASIVKRVTGYNLFQFLQLRLFDHMGISGVYCDSCVSGRDQGGGGSRMKTEDMARLTVLFLNGGVWNGQQLVPESWIDRMTVSQFEKSADGSHPDWKDWRCGYGFQVWMCQPPNTFRFDGMYGQLGVVLKDYDASIITTCGEHDTQSVLRLMWEYLVPAMEEREITEDQSGIEAELEEAKKGLHICWPMVHEVTPQRQKQLWATIDKKSILFPENRESVLASGRVANCYTSSWTEKSRTGIQRMKLTLADGGCQLEYEDNRNHGILPVGIHGEPERGLLKSLWGDYRVWTAARWNAAGSLELQVRMVNGEYYQVFTFSPGEGEVSVNIYGGPWNRRKGKPEGSTWVCRLEEV